MSVVDFTELRDRLNQNCPTGYVLRRDLKKMTGGILQPGTMANLDSQGLGIGGKVQFGKYIGYKVENVIEFMEKKYATS
ncbi:MAG: hypothetical protein ACQESN_10440 [Thermotogota bacterium]